MLTYASSLIKVQASQILHEKDHTISSGRFQRISLLADDVAGFWEQPFTGNWCSWDTEVRACSSCDGRPCSAHQVNGDDVWRSEWFWARADSSQTRDATHPDRRSITGRSFVERGTTTAAAYWLVLKQAESRAGQPVDYAVRFRRTPPPLSARLFLYIFQLDLCRPITLFACG